MKRIKMWIAAKSFANGIGFEEAFALFEKLAFSVTYDEKKPVFSSEHKKVVENVFDTFDMASWTVERNREDVQNYFSAVLYISNKEKWMELKQSNRHEDLKSLYGALGLEQAAAEDNFTIEEMNKCQPKENVEAVYHIIYRIWCAAKNGTLNIEEHFGGASFFKMLECLYTGYLDMAAKYKDQIIEASEKARVDCNSVLTAYCKMQIENKVWDKDKYVEVYWEDSKGNSLQIKDLQETDKVIKLVGNAGVGKSETLKYLRNKNCHQYLQDGESVPVLISLKDVTEENTIIKLIAAELMTNEEVVEDLLKNSKLRLYLDGYNEVKQRFLVKKQIDDEKGIVNKYNPYVIMTDRSEKTTPKCLCSNSKCYSLKPLGKGEVEKYFEKKVENKETLNLLLNALQEGGVLQWIFTSAEGITPYELEAIILVAERTGSILSREEFIPEYLKALLDREEEQKGEENILDLKRWMRMIAVSMVRNYKKENFIPDSEMDRIWKEELQWTSSEFKMFFEWATSLPIIETYTNELKNEGIRFVKDKYKNYFFNKINHYGYEK